MRDLTERETAPLDGDTDRYFCVWPGCDWYADASLRRYIAANQWNLLLEPGPVEALRRWHDHVEDMLNDHLDSAHPGWTLEQVQSHARAWSIEGMLVDDPPEAAG